MTIILGNEAAINPHTLVCTMPQPFYTVFFLRGHTTGQTALSASLPTIPSKPLQTDVIPRQRRVPGCDTGTTGPFARQQKTQDYVSSVIAEGCNMTASLPPISMTQHNTDFAALVSKTSILKCKRTRMILLKC